jgi:hypothetical protein
MNRFWRVASGLSVFLMAAFAIVSLVLNLTFGEPPLVGGSAILGIFYRVVAPMAACIIIFFSFAGSYLLLKGPTASK